MKRSRSFILILICGLFQVTALGQNEFIKVESNEDQPLYSVEFGDEMVGYIGGANATLLKTTNGGSIWKHVDIKDAPWVFSKMDIIQMDFINKDTGYAIVGDHSRRSLNTAIWKTVDGGLNWTSIIVTVNMVPWRIYTTGIDTGFVAGTAYFQGSVISNLSGDSVVNLHSFSWDGANYIEAMAIHADNPSFVMAVTNVPSVHRSFDGGLSWDTVTSNIDTAFNDLAYVGNGTWVACTKSHESLQITKDSGKTWKWLPTTFAYPTYNALCISQKDSIVSVGYSGSFKQGEIGYFHRSTQRYQSVPQKMHDVACSSITTIAVGDSGAIYVKNKFPLKYQTIEKTHGIHFYPNPTNGTLVFKEELKGKVNIFTMDGRLIKKIGLKSQKLDVSDLKKGTYILNAELLNSKSSIWDILLVE